MQAFTLDDVNATETKQPDMFGVTTASTDDELNLSAGDTSLLHFL